MCYFLMCRAINAEHPHLQVEVSTRFVWQRVQNYVQCI